MNERISDPHTQYLALQSALSSLPLFDGSRPSLRSFVYDIENAKGFLPVETKEELFVRGVIAKLKGAAKDCVDGCSFKKVDDLIKHLKSHFSRGRDFKSYHQELAKLVMLPDETVREYGARVQYLERGAKATLADKNQSAEAIKQLMDAVNPVECFIDGLPSDLEMRVSARKPGDLETAIEYAVEEDRRAMSRRRTRESTVHYSRRDFSPDPRNSYRNHDSRERSDKYEYERPYYQNRSNENRQAFDHCQNSYREASPYRFRSQSPVRYSKPMRPSSPSQYRYQDDDRHPRDLFNRRDEAAKEFPVRILNRDNPNHPASPAYPRGSREIKPKNVTWNDYPSSKSNQAPFCAFCNDLGHETSRCRNPANPRRVQTSNSSSRAYSPARRTETEAKYEAPGHLNSQSARCSSSTASAPVRAVRAAAAATRSDARIVIPAAQLSRLKFDS